MCGKTKLHEKIASENKETINWEKSGHYLQYFVCQFINCQPICFTFGGRPCNLMNVRNNSKKGDVLMVMVFAQNWSHKRQDEIQGAYWSRSQTTLHPIIIYYPCPEDCRHLICDEVIVISDDLIHDSFAVKAFMDRVLEHLKEKNVPVE